MQIAVNSPNYNKKKYRAGFGFNYQTHRFITKKAIEFVPEISQTVENFSQKPYLREKFINKQTVMNFLQTILNSNFYAQTKLNKLAINKSRLKALISESEKAQTVTDLFKQELADATMLPDLLKSETGFQTNRHFYFKPQFSPRHFSESYGLNPKKNNALSAYLGHLKKVIYTKSKEENLAQETGMALHFLQDMTVPLHTRRQCFLGKVYDFFIHRDFETQILNNHEKLAENYHPNFKQLEEKLSKSVYPHEDIFYTNVDFSTRPQMQVLRTNKKDWPQIQQEIFNQAVDSTIVELKNIIKNLSKID